MIVRYEKHPDGPRVYFSQVRVHHWEVGAVMMALGAWLTWDDRKDLPFKRRIRLAARFDPEVGVTTSTGVW